MGKKFYYEPKERNYQSLLFPSIFFEIAKIPGETSFPELQSYP